MRMRHTTLSYNVDNIMNRGISTAYSQGKMKVVWVHVEEKTTWAFLHVIRRHGGRVEDVVTLEVEVDPAKLVRTSEPGLFYLREDIAPEYIRDVIGFQTVSRSPLEGSRRGRK